MKNQKVYEADDQLISIIRDNYNVLQSLGSFGISLGFGDKTVKEVCEKQHVDTDTFLAVVNFTINGYLDQSQIERLDVATLLHYLRASHEYFMKFQLPFIRKELEEALDLKDNLAKLILKLYDNYMHSITAHMTFEERTLFPYVQRLLDGQNNGKNNIDTFSKHHTSIAQKLKELKSIIIKYLPADGMRNNQLTATLYDLYNNEEWLNLHSDVEDNIFVPAIRHLETRLQKDISIPLPANGNMLSERERDVVVSIVNGMSNKEIADHLNISLNTVITHRRNIARKLQIHSAAGLTIYAIVNKLVDLSSVKL
ncbi:MAG: LuxR C-terminal-related transcriptional regulator [Prevotella sp.]|jgi:regulator of cell morphogenesis and NO signaling